MKPDLYLVEPDGTKTDKWIFEELLGDDPVDADYAHNIDAPVQATDTYRGLFNLYSPDQPRDEAGRFAETGSSPYAAAPRVFNTPDEIVQHKDWGETTWRWKDKETGQASGHLLTGEPIPREALPQTLYHVTTNAPAVESSGVLLGQRADAGIGGGQADGVSFTTSREDARVIQRELTRSVKIARGDDLGMNAIERYAREDEREVGLPAGTLNRAVNYARQNWHDPTPADVWGSYDLEALGRSYTKDALNAYLQIRDDVGKQHPLLKNPILFGNPDKLKLIDPASIKTLTVPTKNIPGAALVTTGSDKFLHEVRVYADVPSGGTLAHVLSYREKLQQFLLYSEDQPRDDQGRWAGGGTSELTARDRARDQKFKEEFERLGAKERERTAREQGIAKQPPVAYRHNQATHEEVEGRLKELVSRVFVSQKKQTCITAASHVADVLEQMHAKGYTLPDSVTVQAGTKRSLYGAISYEKGARHLTVEVPITLPANANLDHAAVIAFGGKATADGTPGGAYDRFSIRSMNDVVVHEMAHVQAGLRAPREGSVIESKAAQTAAMRHVSLYGATNQDEFIAESFVKLYRGETLPEDSARLYKALHGPVVKEPS